MGNANLLPALKQKIQFFAQNVSTFASTYLCPSFSGIAYDLAFLVHDLNPSRGLQASGHKNIQCADLGCGLTERTQQGDVVQ